MLLVATLRPLWASMVVKISMLSIVNVGDAPSSFFVARFKTFLAAVHASVGTNTAIFFLDDVHEGRKGLLMVFKGEGACVNGMVVCTVLELSELCHCSLLTNFTKFLEPGVETVGLGEGSTNNVWVGIMKHCYTQDVHVMIRVNRRWVIVVVARTDRDMHGAVLIGPVRIYDLLYLCDAEWGNLC